MSKQRQAITLVKNKIKSFKISKFLFDIFSGRRKYRLHYETLTSGIEIRVKYILFP